MAWEMVAVDCTQLHAHMCVHTHSKTVLSQVQGYPHLRVSSRAEQLVRAQDTKKHRVRPCPPLTAGERD